MPRPQYTQEELTQLANRYQAQAYPYIEGLVAQLYELDHDETRPQGSRAYLARKAHLNSQIYLMTRYAMMPVRTSNRAIRRSSMRTAYGTSPTV